MFGEQIESRWLAGWAKAAQFVGEPESSEGRTAIAACLFEHAAPLSSPSLQAERQGLLDGLHAALGNVPRGEV